MENLMDRLFSNTGKKIKTLAKILAWLILISEMITGFSMMFVDDDALWILMCLGIIVASPFTAFLSSVFMYGFGIIVDCAENNLTSTDGSPKPATKPFPPSTVQSTPSTKESPNTCEENNIDSDRQSDNNDEVKTTEEHIASGVEQKDVREELIIIAILVVIIIIFALPILFFI